MRKLDLRFVSTLVVYILLSIGASGCILSDITSALTGAKKTANFQDGNTQGANDNGQTNTDPFAKDGKLVDGLLTAFLDCGDLTGDDGNSADNCEFTDLRATPSPSPSFSPQPKLSAVAVDQNPNTEEQTQNDNQEGDDLPPSRLALFDDDTGVFTQGGVNVPFTFEAVLKRQDFFDPTIEDGEEESFCDEGSSGDARLSDLRINIPGQGTLLGHMTVTQGTCIQNFDEEFSFTRNFNCMQINGAIFEEGEALPIENVEDIYASEEIPTEFLLLYSLDPDPNVNGCEDLNN